MGFRSFKKLVKADGSLDSFIALKFNDGCHTLINMPPNFRFISFIFMANNGSGEVIRTHGHTLIQRHQK